MRRLVGELRPERTLLILVVLLAVASVAFAVVGPKILGNATNILFEGVVNQQIPAGTTKEQAVAGLRAQGQDRIADMISEHDAGPRRRASTSTPSRARSPCSPACTW